MLLLDVIALWLVLSGIRSWSRRVLRAVEQPPHQCVCLHAPVVPVPEPAPTPLDAEAWVRGRGAMGVR